MKSYEYLEFMQYVKQIHTPTDVQVRFLKNNGYSVDNGRVGILNYIAFRYCLYTFDTFKYINIIIKHDVHECDMEYVIQNDLGNRLDNGAIIGLVSLLYMFIRNS